MTERDRLIVRLDERLIHAQVLIGWLATLEIPQLILASQRVRDDAASRELYEMIVPEEVQLQILSEEEAGTLISEEGKLARQCLVLVESVASLARLHIAGGGPCGFHAAHIGGVYHRARRRRFRDGLFLTCEEEQELRRLMAAGLELSFQPLPGTTAVRLWEIFDGA